jgi:hypothetical protein
LKSPSKKASRCDEEGDESWTRLSLVGPNQTLTSRGREEKGPSTTARRRMGSVGARVSSIARTVDLEVSETAAHHPTREGIYMTEG